MIDLRKREGVRRDKHTNDFILKITPHSKLLTSSSSLCLRVVYLAAI